MHKSVFHCLFHGDSTIVGIRIPFVGMEKEKLSCHGDVVSLVFMVAIIENLVLMVCKSHRDSRRLLQKMQKEIRWMERNTCIECRQQLQTFIAITLLFMLIKYQKPIVFYPKLLLEGKKHIGLFHNELRSTKREGHFEGLLSREGMGLLFGVHSNGRECHESNGWMMTYNALQ